MKRVNYILVILTLALTSCTAGVIPTEEKEVNAQATSHSQTPIQITTSIIHNAATKAEDASSEYIFQPDDQIGVSMMVDGQPAVINVPFTLTDGKWVPEESIYYPDHGKEATLSFYFPYRKDVLPNKDLKGYIHLSTNQNSLGKMEQFSTCQLNNVSETDSPLVVSLELQLIKIHFQIEAGADYTLDDLQNTNLELTDCFTHGVYDFNPMSFNDYYGLESLSPAGAWVIENESKVVQGEYCLIFPNTTSNMTEVIHIGEQQFSAKIPTETLSGESIQAGHAYTFKLTPNNENRTYSQSSLGVEVTLTSWTQHATEEVSQTDHQASNGLVIKDLDFTKSKILSIMHKENEVALITKELGVDEETSTAAEQIIAYPKVNNVVDWSAGIILSKNGLPEEASIYIKDDYTLSASYINGGVAIYTAPKVLKDKRNGHIYPLVRIGDLTWTAEDVHEKMAIDYTPLEQTASMPPNSLDPLYLTWTDSRSSEHYFYPTATLSNYHMAPQGWRLPNQADIMAMIKEFNNPEYLLSSTANNTGLALNQSGYIAESTHIGVDTFAGLWVSRENDFLLFSIEPKSTGGYAYHLYGNPTNLFDFDTSALPIRWVAE